GFGLLNVPIGHMNAWYKRWVGGLLGGDATRIEVAAVAAWSLVPTIVGHGGLWIARFALYGRELFAVEHPTIDPAPPLVRPSFCIGALLFSGWSLAISVVGFAEVNRFSIARSIGTTVLGTLIVVLTAAVAVVVLLVAVGWLR